MHAKILMLGAVMALAVAPGAPVQATTLNWTLHNVTFDDGGTASGSFSIDSSSGDITAFDITTTGGSTLGGATYDTSNSSLYANDLFSSNSFVIATNNTYFNPYINLAFFNPLTSGGVDALVMGGPLAGSWECDNCTALRNVTSGFASSVPEPAGWALMLAGFGALGASLRAGRKTTIATA